MDASEAHMDIHALKSVFGTKHQTHKSTIPEALAFEEFMAGP